MKMRYVVYIVFLLSVAASIFVRAQEPTWSRPGELTIEKVRAENPFQKGDPKYTTFDGIIVVAYELALQDGLSKHVAATNALDEFNMQLTRYVTGEEPVILGAYHGRGYEIKTAEYRSVYDNRDAATQWAEIEQYYGKRSLLDTDTFPTRRANADEFKRGITSVAIPQAVGPKKDVLLVAYTVYTAFGGLKYSSSVIIQTDALRKDVPQGGDEAQLLNEVIAALSARGELRNVRMDRPAEAYVEILGWTPVRSAKFIYSTRLPEWQSAQLGKE